MKSKFTVEQLESREIPSILWFSLLPNGTFTTKLIGSGNGIIIDQLSGILLFQNDKLLGTIQEAISWSSKGKIYCKYFSNEGEIGYIWIPRDKTPQEGVINL